MQNANPLWGAPRIHGELQKLGIEIAQATVAKYLARYGGTAPSQTWRTLVDRPTDPRGVAVGYRPPVRDTRSRLDLWIRSSACRAVVIVWNERSLRRHLRRYLTCYHEWRTHLSLDKDAPSHGLCNRRPAAQSSRSHTSAGCIITTNVGLPDHRSRGRRSACYACRRPAALHPDRVRVVLQRRRIERSDLSVRPVGGGDRGPSGDLPMRVEFLVGTGLPAVRVSVRVSTSDLLTEVNGKIRGFVRKEW